MTNFTQADGYYPDQEQRLTDALAEHDRILEEGLPEAWDPSASPGSHIDERVVIVGDRSKLFIGTNVRIDAFVKLEIGKGISIGDDTHVASFVSLNVGGGLLTIGERCGIACGVRIVTGGNDVDAPTMTATSPEASRTYKSHVILRDDVSVLVNAVVLPGCVLENGSRLGALSLLTSSIPANEIWVGCPAQRLRARRG